MSEQTAAWIMMAVGTGQALLLLVMLTTLRDPGALSKRLRRSPISRKLLTITGVLMTALDDALARFTAFVKDVVGQLTATKDVNAEQTGKIAELQAALDAALSDDAADKASISALQAEIATLQDEVAAKINSTLDTLANPPVVAPVVEEAPVEEAPVEEAPSDDLVVVDEGAGDGSVVIMGDDPSGEGAV